MNKAELVASIAGKSGLTKKDAEKAIDALIDTVQESLRQGDKVSLVGFGTFEVRSRAPRKGRNPQTGQEIEIAAARVPVFKAGKSFKEAME